MEFSVKERYGIEELLQIMQMLRSPDGCPWDRDQTHLSIRNNFLEETHEAIEAINNGDNAALREELGDVLLQIVFHSRIAEEDGAFRFDDVVDEISRKLVIRHPHVFGDVVADNTDDVLRNWDTIKRETKGDKTQADLLRAVPRSLPALMRADKVQGRAARVGFDWPDESGAVAALASELDELRQAIASGDISAVEEELGDVLFSAVNTARLLHVDAEQALTCSSDKFIRRFDGVEQLAEQRGIVMSDVGLPVLDSLWDEVKAKEK